jgi:hypothetical protein
MSNTAHGGGNGHRSIVDYDDMDLLHAILDVCFIFIGILECRICMGSRESSEISVVQCEVRYTPMLQRLCDPKYIQRIGEREHWGQDERKYSRRN